MKRIIKVELGLVIFALVFATALNATGLNQNMENKQVIFNENIISVPNSEIILKFWEQKTDDGISLPFYSISLDGGETVVRTHQPSYELGLRYEHFDPLVETPTVESDLSSGADTNLYIVQFLTQPLEEFKNTIESLGGFCYQYIAQFAYVVEMDENVKSQVESLSYVRWIGPYHPAYRLEEFMIDNFENAEQAYPLQRYNIQVHTIDKKEICANKIENIGGIVNKANGGKILVEATLTPEQLFSVARLDEVNFIDRWSEYEVDMDNGREIGGANYIETVGGYTGKDVRGEIFDTGVNPNHVDFQENPLIVHGPSCGTDSHGTACCGINFGTGTGNPSARGLLPDGQGIIADYSVIGLEGTNRYDHSGELVEEPFYAVFQTASVGSGRTTQYTTVSADSDAAVFDFDLIHCQSQSNAGNQNSRPQAWAKNMVSGGAVWHFDTLTKSDDMWDGPGIDASIGPASDGRIKPTFCFFYDDILTVGYPGNNDYTYGFGGTSGATPMTAGHFGLFFEMWDDGIFGNEVDPNGTVFENKAHFSTAKAMIINTAEQYPFTGTSHDKTRMHQGWGMPNLTSMYDLREKFYIVDETDILEPFEVSTHTVYVEAGEPFLKATMHYPDTPGNPAVQTQHRINDLTLKVISPCGEEYWGNHGLLESVWSTTGGSADDKNTVECVFIEDPEEGSWKIEIHADEVIEDTHVETTELDADYALVVSPVLAGPEPPIIDGPTEVIIGEENDFTIRAIDPAGYDLYYYINWGDGTYEEWIGPYPSNETITASHAWTKGGDFAITAKVKNSQGSEGGWSMPHYVTVLAPELDIDIIRGGFFRARAAIKNIGGADATNVEWNMVFHGGLILLGKSTTGVIDIIPAGGQETIESNRIIGFGPTICFVNTEEGWGSTDDRDQSGFLLGIYVRIKPGGGGG
jgi:hypothetical protein